MLYINLRLAQVSESPGSQRGGADSKLAFFFLFFGCMKCDAIMLKFDNQHQILRDDCQSALKIRPQLKINKAMY